MIPFRHLTPAEIDALPPGLVAVVPVAGVRLIGRHHPVSWLARLVGRGPQIVVRGRRIFWPGLEADFSASPLHMSLLAHELIHVWQYENGMTLWRYVLRERGRYAYRVDGRAFTEYGYEQQAAMVEDWMRLRAGLGARWGVNAGAENLTATIPFLG